MAQAKIGVIGGTGLYEIDGMTDIKEIHVETPFGDTSDNIILGKLNGTGIAFLPRHGRGHKILPHEIPARANIYALKSLGVEHVIGVNSCGSFKEELKPGELLVPDQVIDRSQGRISTFFGGGVVALCSAKYCINPDRNAEPRSTKMAHTSRWKVQLFPLERSPVFISPGARM
jgi:5'-methylthioadenosine phosphorylase